MKIFKSAYFLSCLCIYLMIQAGRMMGWIQSGVLDNFITDLICMPIVFVVLLSIVRSIKGDSTISLPWYSVIGFTIYWSVYFEWYLPSQSTNYTADSVDVLMYFLGAASFLIWQRKELKKPLRPKYYQ